jgi:hypothetical protein
MGEPIPQVFDTARERKASSAFGGHPAGCRFWNNWRARRTGRKSWTPDPMYVLSGQFRIRIVHSWFGI